MTYKSYKHYCVVCKKTMYGMGIASHLRGKKHKENLEEAKRLGKSYGIVRLDG